MHNTCNPCGTRRNHGCCNLLEQIAELLFEGGFWNDCGTCRTNGCYTTWTGGCVRNTCCCQKDTQGIPVYGRVYLQTTGGLGDGVNTNGQTTNGFVRGGCGCAFANANGFNTNGYTPCGYTPYTRNTCGY